MKKLEKGKEKLVKGDEKRFARAVCGICQDPSRYVTYYAFEPLTEMSYTVCSVCYNEWKKRKVWRIGDIDYKFDAMVWESMECFICNSPKVIAKYRGRSYAGNPPRILYFCEKCLLEDKNKIDLLNALLYIVDTEMVLEMPDIKPLVEGLQTILQTKGKEIANNSAKPFLQKYIKTFKHIFFSDYAYIKQNYRIFFKNKEGKYER